MAQCILVVEDDPQNLYLVSFLLSEHGFDVVTAGDGEAALEQAALAHPDLILMDMLLPKLDGYEATRRLKSDPKVSSIPVVALTAYSMKGDEERILQVGCDGYISKPIDPETFVELIAGYLPATTS
jgi:two-component system, cell cycle response regulator DivK